MYCDILAVVDDIYNLLQVQKKKAKIAKYHEMRGKWCLFLTVWSKNVHILTRSWMGEWTWTNDNNKHKHHDSNSVNFSMMVKFNEVMEFGITPHVSYMFKS